MIYLVTLIGNTYCMYIVQYNNAEQYRQPGTAGHSQASRLAMDFVYQVST